MKDCTVKIVANEPISQNFYRLKFQSDELTTPNPGQFLNLKVNELSVPMLRRPFAYSNWEDSTKIAEIIYQKRGTATNILCQKKVGETVRVLGPLGNGFLFPEKKELTSVKRFYLVAGGIGLGPMIYLHKTLLNLDKQAVLIAGFRFSDLIPSEKVIPEGTVICTDDGTVGFKGTVVDYLNSIEPEDLEDAAILCCGPVIMMKYTHLFAQEKQIPCFVSMEEMMGCGVGACMGCAVKTTDTHGVARVCTEGPVFNSEAIAWN